MEKAVSDKGRGSGVGAMTRFIFRHIVRSPLKSLLTLLLGRLEKKLEFFR